MGKPSSQLPPYPVVPGSYAYGYTLYPAPLASRYVRILYPRRMHRVCRPQHPYFPSPTQGNFSHTHPYEQQAFNTEIRSAYKRYVAIVPIHTFVATGHTQSTPFEFVRHIGSLTSSVRLEWMRGFALGHGVRLPRTEGLTGASLNARLEMEAGSVGLLRGDDGKVVASSVDEDARWRM